ncbi:MAG: GNAT family N-acetyltransferase [Candidatus Levyibacteriota bacterium]
MEFVSFQSKDVPAVVSFFREIFQESGWKEEPSDYIDHPDVLFHVPNNGFLLLVKEDGELIGTAGVIKMNDTEGLLKRFYVKKSYRDSGIAQQLLNHVITEAKVHSVTKLILDVSKNNIPAIKFYEKSGFLQTAVVPEKDWPESNFPETHLYFYKVI